MHPGLVRLEESGTTWAKPRPCWYRLASTPSTLGSQHRILAPCSCFLTPLGPRCLS
jgi:hypothetical protein